MAYLLDTHALIWATTKPELLGKKFTDRIKGGLEPVFYSICSLWEITIKSGTGKLEIVQPLSRFFDVVRMSNFQELRMTNGHLLTLSDLPDYHRDPFDRMLIAQAIAEGYTLISRDTEFKNYPVPILW